MSGLNAALSRPIGIEDYLVWSTVLGPILFVPLSSSIELGYLIPIFNSLILLAMNRLAIHRNHLLALMAIIALSLVGTRVSGTSSTVIVAQILGIGVLSVYYFSALTTLGLTPTRWMETYVWLALAIAVVGIALWPLEYLFDDGRLKAIYSEPSFYVYVTLPAVGYCVNAYVNDRRYGPEILVFVLSYVLAASSLGFLGLMLIGLVTFGTWLKGWKVVGLAALLAVVAAGLYFASGNVRVRANEMAAAIATQDLSNTGATTFAFLGNVYVASQSFLEHPWTGIGIGGYANAYDKYIGDVSGVGEIVTREHSEITSLQLNREDGASMFLRVAAELGLPGLVVLFGFLIVCASVKGQPYAAIRNAILPYLIIRMMRMGHYFTVELYFFVGIYLLNYLNYRTQPGSVLAKIDVKNWPSRRLLPGQN